MIVDELSTLEFIIFDVFDKTLELTKILLILFPFSIYLIAFISSKTSNLYAGIWEPIPRLPTLSLKIFVPDVIHLEEFVDATDNLPVPSKLNEASYKRDKVFFTRLNGGLKRYIFSFVSIFIFKVFDELLKTLELTNILLILFPFNRYVRALISPANPVAIAPIPTLPEKNVLVAVLFATPVENKKWVLA